MFCTQSASVMLFVIVTEFVEIDEVVGASTDDGESEGSSCCVVKLERADV